MLADSELEMGEGELRHGDSFKWTKYPADVLPLWVADMDFRVAGSIRQALAKRVDGGIGYGYGDGDAALMELLRGKLERLGVTGLPAGVGAAIGGGWIGFLNGVVQGLYGAVAGLTGVGEEVLTMTPIYPPFLGAIADQGRRTRQVPLVQGEQGSGGGWKIDWPAMGAAVTPATRLLMLCHPHNPTGRIWSGEELTQLSTFAERHRLWVVSDELHADLSLDGGFVPFASVASPEVRMRTVTLTGPCKTYNTAGVGIGAMISHNPEIVARIKKVGGGLLGHAGTLSVTMWRTALQDDGEWLTSVLGYLRRNREFLTGFVRERLPGVVFHPPQATYLAWLDYRGHRNAGEIQQYLLAEGKVALNDGPMFGTGYQGFVRLNFATSAVILKEALERMARVH